MVDQSELKTREPSSLALSLASLPLLRQQEILASLSSDEAERLRYLWEFWRRPEQTPPPGEWDVWLYMAGRGAGKTRTASEWVRDNVEGGSASMIHLVARTSADVRDTMVLGESGLLTISPPWFRPDYEPSKRRLTWPNGAMALTFTAEAPDQLRGPQCDLYWADEVASWKYDQETWDQLQFGARLGSRPRGIVTTTPRPTKIMRSILADKGAVTTRGSTYDNRGNLAPPFLRRMLERYGGTTLGRQELDAEMLDGVVGALWQRALFDDHRVAAAPPLVRIVVAIDPATTKKKTSADTGIIGAGLGEDGHGYVLDDVTCHVGPNEWASRAVKLARDRKADRVVGEVNNGGDLVEAVIRSVDSGVSFKAVSASKGKHARAEPVAALYEQGKVHHVGMFAELEDQCCTWLPTDDESPDRMDALVWAMTELMGGAGSGFFLV